MTRNFPGLPMFSWASTSLAKCKNFRPIKILGWDQESMEALGYLVQCATMLRNAP
jgi:hypothetical protein